MRGNFHRIAGPSALALAIALIGCSQSAKTSDEGAASGSLPGAPAPANARVAMEEDEVAVPLDQVPANVRAAAEAAVPGVVFTAAERETENGVVTYDLEGSLGGVPHEVEVTAAGVVVEIETGDDDDDDDDDDSADEDGDDDGN